VEDNARMEVRFAFNTKPRAEAIPIVKARRGGIEGEGAYKNAI